MAKEELRFWYRKTLAPSTTARLRKKIETDAQPRHLLTESSIHRFISEEA